MSCATLLELPPEILRIICAQFCAHCTPKSELTRAQSTSRSTTRSSSDTRDLINLSQTCRSLHHTVGPFVYHEFIFRHWRPWEVVHFLSTVSQRPELAACVRHLVINEDPSLFAVRYASFIHKEATRHSLPFPNDWSLLLDSSVNEDRFWGLVSYEQQQRLDLSTRVFIDLVLSLFPNVEQLHLQVPSDDEIGRFFSPSTNLSTLKALHLSWENYNWDLDPETFELSGLRTFSGVFEMASNLESLEVDMCFSASSGLALGNLRRLKLKDAFLRPQDLQALVAQSSKLETFIFHCSLSYKVYPVDTRTLPPKQLPECLLVCKNTLRHLEIQQCTWDFSAIQPDDYITSLKEFTALETVILDAQSLTEAYEGESDSEDREPFRTPSLVNLLPASVKTVSIEGYHPDLHAAINDLILETKRGNFQSLEKLSFVGASYYLTPPDIEMLEEACGVIGVSFDSSFQTKFLIEY